MSRASHFPTPGNEQEKMTPATSGPPSSQAFAHYDPDSSSWKTWPAISLWGLDEFSGTWPKRGTTRNGFAYELPTSAPPTDAPACSSLLPTPTAQEPGGTAEQYRARWRRSDGRESTFLPLSMVAPALLPTPLASDGEKGGPNQRGGAGDLRLSSAVQPLAPHAATTPTTTTPAGSAPGRAAGTAPTRSGDVPLLPTPNARDGDPRGSQHPDSRLAGGHQVNLNDVTEHLLLPTPTAADSNQSGGNSPSNVTLTDAVVRTSLGARTNPRFAGGNTSSDGPRHDQPTLDATDGNDYPPDSSSS